MMTMQRMTEQELDRWATKISREGDCHLWTGHLDKDGYGSFYFRRKNRRAHRVGWYLTHGEIPKGMFVNHKCGNRHCVNAQHLELLTPRENALQDSKSPAAINARKTHCPQGHPYDRTYARQRYCSICEAAKRRRLRQQWKAEADQLNV